MIEKFVRLKIQTSDDGCNYPKRPDECKKAEIP